MIDKVLPGMPIEPGRQVHPATPGAVTAPGKMPGDAGIAFRQLLDETLRTQGGVKFSAHAVKRMESRGICLKPGDVTALEDAVQRAEVKGSRDSLVLSPSYAMVVNVPSRTVVTAFDQQQLKENVVTNIDSTVFVLE